MIAASRQLDTATERPVNPGNQQDVDVGALFSAFDKLRTVAPLYVKTRQQCF
jgi:hypothetical protein